MNEKFIFKGNSEPHDLIDRLEPPPPWRSFSDRKRTENHGKKYYAGPEEIEIVNAALYLRRPLLITGKPGTGKTSLAYAVAYELGLGAVLPWAITTRSTLQQGLYSYDAVGRLQETARLKTREDDGRIIDELADIGRFIRLGALGTAMLPRSENDPHRSRPRALLIDEIDKSDIDLPNDLLNIFEEGEFEIPELARLPDEEKFRHIQVLTGTGEKALIERGKVQCANFPFVVMTSNGEREFPPAFLRRCLRLEMQPHTPEMLAKIVRERLMPGPDRRDQVQSLIDEFVSRQTTEGLELATDQLLNAVYLLLHGLDPMDREDLRQVVFRSLSDYQ